MMRVVMIGGETHFVKEYLDIFPPPTAARVSNGGVCASGQKRWRGDKAHNTM